MGAYTAVYEAGNGIVEHLRRHMTPEPVSKPELIGLGNPFEPEDYQLTVHLYHMEENSGGVSGFVQESKTQQRLAPINLRLHYLITAHSKAPVQSRAADEQRIMGRLLQVLRDEAIIDFSLLSGSLKDEGESLTVNVDKLNYEQMVKVWNSTSKPFKLSIACQCGVTIRSNKVRTVSRVIDAAFHTEEIEPMREVKTDE